MYCHIPNKEKPLTMSAKRKVMCQEAKELIEAGILTTNNGFEKRLEVFRAFTSAWRQNKEVHIGIINDIPNISSLTIDETASNLPLNNNYSNGDIQMPTSLKLRGRSKQLNKPKSHTMSKH